MRKEGGVGLTNARNHVLLVVFSLLSASAYSFSAISLQHKNVSDAIPISIALFLSFLIVSELSLLLISKSYSVHAEYYSKRKIFALAFIAAFVSYMLCMLCFYPGTGMNDGLNILYNGTMETANQVPVFYCAYILLLMKAGSPGNLQVVIALYTFIQVIICALLSAYIQTWIVFKQIPTPVKIICLIYLCICPIICIYTITMVKDVVFSMLVAVLVTCYYDLVSHQGSRITPGFWVFMAIVTVGIIVTRNNGIYVVLLCALVGIFVFKDYRKQLLVQCLVIALTVLAVNAAMSAVGAKQMFKEAVGIPLQQVSATIAYDGEMSDEDLAFMNNIEPISQIKENYDPGNADKIKWRNDFNSDYLDSHKIEFMNLWLRNMKDNFAIYTRAYLMQTCWFWTPDPTKHAGCYFSIETVYNNDWLVPFMEENGIHDEPIITGKVGEALRSYYFLSQYYPAEGLCLWIMLMTLLLNAIKFKSPKNLMFYLPTLALWATIMISTPINRSFRYMYVYAFVLVIYYAVLFVNEQRKQSRDTLGYIPQHAAWLHGDPEASLGQALGKPMRSVVFERPTRSHRSAEPARLLRPKASIPRSGARQPGRAWRLCGQE